MSTTDEPMGSAARHPAAPTSPVDTPVTAPYDEMQRSPEFAALRRRWRGFVFPASALFLVWFLAYVLLSAYAPGVVNTTLGGSNITVGLILGLLQFVSTFVIATLYTRFADRSLDPEASRLRAEVEERL